jgi:Uma2 family endonuclease
MSTPRLFDGQTQTAQQTLPTMYDLPSESAEDPGLPDVRVSASTDEFHDLQPQLLSATFRPLNYARSDFFTGTDLNLYYDSDHTQWYKRPDWFAAVGVPRLYLSYVVWQERVNPAVVVELLSPGTEQEDLGQTERQPGQPPTKWQVYEQVLNIPHYIIYDRYTRTLRAYRLENGCYQERPITESRIWLADLQIGLGLWQGTHDDIFGYWLRWYDANGDWILTETEQAQLRADQEKQLAEQERLRADQERQLAEQAQQRAEQEKQRADALAQRLRDLGLEP